MTLRRIAIVITARPSYSRVKTVCQALLERDDTVLLPIVAGSGILPRYGNVAALMAKDGIFPRLEIPTVVEGETALAASLSTGMGCMQVAMALDQLKPDVVVSIADRYETLGTSAAAAISHIPLCHIQGGEITGSIDEKVRHANTKLADLHCVSTTQARQVVCMLGEDPATVHVTGCPSIDLAKRSLDMDPLTTLPEGIGPAIRLDKPFLVILQHPVTTERHDAARQIDLTIEAVRRLGIPAFWFWPNIDPGSADSRLRISRVHEKYPDAQLNIRRNLPGLDFLRLIRRSACLVGNSSVAIREGSYLGVPAVNIGNRQDGREQGGNVLSVPYSSTAIEYAIRHQIGMTYPRSTLYGDGDAGPRIAELLATEDLRCQKRLLYSSGSACVC